MFEGVIQALQHDEHDRRSLFRRQNDALAENGHGDVVARRRPERVFGDLAGEGVEGGRLVFGVREVPLDARNQGRAGGGVAEGLARAGIGGAARLDAQQGADYLNVIGDAMLNLLQQEVAAGRQSGIALHFAGQSARRPVHADDEENVDGHNEDIETHSNQGRDAEIKADRPDPEPPSRQPRQGGGEDRGAEARVIGDENDRWEEGQIVEVRPWLRA